jgi:hypothetical protein
MLPERARRLAELIIDQLEDADGQDLPPGEIRELEALIWQQLPNP